MVDRIGAVAGRVVGDALVGMLVDDLHPHRVGVAARPGRSGRSAGLDFAPIRGRLARHIGLEAGRALGGAVVAPVFEEKHVVVEHVGRAFGPGCIAAGRGGAEHDAVILPAGDVKIAVNIGGEEIRLAREIPAAVAGERREALKLGWAVEQREEARGGVPRIELHLGAHKLLGIGRAAGVAAGGERGRDGRARGHGAGVADEILAEVVAFARLAADGVEGEEARLVQPRHGRREGQHGKPAEGGGIPLVVAFPGLRLAVPDEQGLRRGLLVERHREIDPLRRDGRRKQRRVAPRDAADERGDAVAHRRVDAEEDFVGGIGGGDFSRAHAAAVEPPHFAIGGDGGRGAVELHFHRLGVEAGIRQIARERGIDVQALALEHEERAGADGHGRAQRIAPAAVHVFEAGEHVVLGGVGNRRNHEIIPAGEQHGALAPGEAVAGRGHGGVAGGDRRGHELGHGIAPIARPFERGLAAAAHEDELVEILKHLARGRHGEAGRKGHDAADFRLAGKHEGGGADAHDPRIALGAGIGEHAAAVGGAVGGGVGRIVVAQIAGAVGKIVAGVAGPDRGGPPAAGFIDALDQAQVERIRHKARGHQGRRAHVEPGKREVARLRREGGRIAGAEGRVAGNHGAAGRRKEISGGRRLP